MTNTKPTNPKDRIGINKAPMSFVPACVIAETGTAMMEGALKYGPYNWRTAGIRFSVYHDATMRHLNAFWEGEDIDPDSGLCHLTKAIASLMVYRDAMIQDKFTDDRPPKSVAFYPMLNELAAELMARSQSRVVTTGILSDEHEALTFGPLGDDEGWIEWHGGDTSPVPSETEVECVLRGGTVCEDKARTFVWAHGQPFISDILKYRVVQPKKDDEGWVEWHGGECPVEPDVEVEIGLRDGISNKGAADNFYWYHSEGFPDSDIIKYRVLK